MSVSITKMMNTLLKNLNKADRMTIDFSNEKDVEFFTSMLKKATRRSVKSSSDTEEEEKPKKAQNSYITFCNETRKNVDFSDIKDPRDVSRRLGEMWRALSDDEKNVYKKQSDDHAGGDRKKSKAVKEPKQKKPLSGFIKFCNAHRAEVAKTVPKPQDVSRRLGEMWKALADDQKLKWKNQDNQEVEPKEETEEEAEEESEPESHDEEDDGMDKMPLQQLKELAKSKGVKGFSKMKKEELIHAIQNA
jgi:hypothetical protein